MVLPAAILKSPKEATGLEISAYKSNIPKIPKYYGNWTLSILNSAKKEKILKKNFLGGGGRFPYCFLS